jgi:hypothetical protein
VSTSGTELTVWIVMGGLLVLMLFGMCQSGKATLECERRKCEVGFARRNEGTNYECQCVTYPQ